jgi:signal recognition particle receptor subunit alpha
MEALAKLVNGCSPDLVLFVGEALVGNDGVDQLSEFNKVRRRHSHLRRCAVTSS